MIGEEMESWETYTGFCFIPFFMKYIYRLAKLEQLIKIGFCVSLGCLKFRIGLYVCFVHTALCCLFITHIHS